MVHVLSAVTRRKGTLPLSPAVQRGMRINGRIENLEIDTAALLRHVGHEELNSVQRVNLRNVVSRLEHLLTSTRPA